MWFFAPWVLLIPYKRNTQGGTTMTLIAVMLITIASLVGLGKLLRLGGGH